ncbi:lipocalin-like domain-containing protein [Mesorhizobium sp. M0601]|uniref:lipocalin-like domain-containing protein n=1 Tax=Mesorhizobium sp. M0601 TaxID=2956969 RepID=UPI00333A55FA
MAHEVARGRCRWKPQARAIFRPVIFTEAGTLSVQAQNPDAKAPDTPYTANGYEAYYGPVAINDQDKTFVITIESSLVRNLVGKSMKRKFEVSDNKLVLTPDNPAEGWRVTYERY